MAEDLEQKTNGGGPMPTASPNNALASDPELLNDFILEAREHLTTIELQLLTLDQDPANQEAIHAVFRGFHTIKGMAGFLDLDAVRDVSHEVETILDLARNSLLAITPEVIDAILASKDYLGYWMGELEAMLQTGRAPGAKDNLALIESIRAVGKSDPVHRDAQPQAARVEVEEPVAPSAVPASCAVLDPPVAAASAGEPIAAGLLDLARELAPTDPPPAEPSPAEAPEAPKPAEAPAAVTRSVKVDTAKLDYLVDMVGEMVIAQSMVRHDPDLATGVKSRLARNLSQLARITDEVQRTAMSMRMLPIGQLFQKTARLVRDLSRKVSKQVDLEVSGEDTELDRNIVEELADPLMHMVRNAMTTASKLPRNV